MVRAVQPPGVTCGTGWREARSVRRFRLAASAAPPFSPGASNYLGPRAGAPQEAGGPAAGGAEVAVTLLGSAGWAAEEAARRLWWRFPDWSRGWETGRGGRGCDGGTQIEGEILPAPEGVLRIFSRQQQALCLCLTRLKHLLPRGGEAANNPHTPCAASPSPAWPLLGFEACGATITLLTPGARPGAPSQQRFRVGSRPQSGPSVGSRCPSLPSKGSAISIWAEGQPRKGLMA